jgi:hypothetical protein
MYCKIDKWYGRLGNNLLQLRNAIIYGLENKCNIIFPKHKYFNTTLINLFESNCNKIIINSIFFTENDINTCIPNMYKDNLCKKYYNRFTKELRNIFILKCTDLQPLGDNDVVIHIRSGDTITDVSCQYVLPPQSYFLNILNNNNFDNIYIVSEDTKNPCIKKILESYPNSKFKIQSLEEDIKLILRAKNIIVSFGTFITSLLLLTDYTKQLYISSFSTVVDGSNIQLNVTDLNKYYHKQKKIKTLIKMIQYNPNVKNKHLHYKKLHSLFLSGLLE